jgi:hypothetical protein
MDIDAAFKFVCMTGFLSALLGTAAGFAACVFCFRPLFQAAEDWRSQKKAANI